MDSNVIYNLFSKALSRLSKEFVHLSKEDFESIARNLLSYINKERQTEQLIDRLLNKIKVSTNYIE